MKKLRGIGLLELMLSLAIIAILLVTATRYYTTTRLNQQIEEAAQMVIAVYSAGQGWIQSHDDFSGVKDIGTFVRDSSVPSDFADPNANPWGGAINAVGSQQSAILIVRMEQIPAKACLNLAEKIKAKISNAATNCVLGQDPTTFTVNFDMSQ